MEKLQRAKKNVIWLLEHSEGLIDMKGLKYWAELVEDLREEVKKTL